MNMKNTNDESKNWNDKSKKINDKWKKATDNLKKSFSLFAASSYAVWIPNAQLLLQERRGDPLDVSWQIFKTTYKTAFQIICFILSILGD